MEDEMIITPLGSGQEVGRSCHLLEFRDMTILLDCGIHPGYDGMNGLPFFDHVEPEQVDVLLITHFHLDHAGSLPYFTERTRFRGRVFMTHPTKAVVRLLLGDYLRLMSIKNSNSSSLPNDNSVSSNIKDSKGNDGVLYTEAELQRCVDKIELIDYHQTISVKSLKFHALNAGHVLGAAMFLLDIGGRTILYTGDYSMEDDRHLMAAEVPNVKPDVLMVESTYGVQVHASRKEREARFTGTIERVVTRGGRCLIPVFALGRAQELLLILDEYWQANPHLQHIPIWYASKLASRALRVCQTYANMMNTRIRAQLDICNPFAFQYINNLKGINVDTFDDRGPSVVFASPGMLQSGVSRQLFDRWCTDPKNGIMIAGYAVENTLAKQIMNSPKEVVTMDGRRQPLNALVDSVSFSAHVDFMQNRDFIDKVDPKHIILVHGQKDEMGRLKGALTLKYKERPESKRPTITMPPNLQEVKLKFTRRRSAKVMGRLADKEDDPKEGDAVRGILVTQNFSSKIVDPEDLSTYTQLRVGSVSSKLHVPYSGKSQSLRLYLNDMFSDVTETTVLDSNEDQNKDANTEMMTSNLTKNMSSEGITTFGLHENEVKVIIGQTRGIATVEWDASPIGDILADSVIALLMHAQSTPAAISMTSQPCRHRVNIDKASNESQDKSNINGDDESPPLKKARELSKLEKIEIRQSQLKLIHELLSNQYQKVDFSIDENASRGKYTIYTDAGLESSTTVSDSMLECVVEIYYDKELDFISKNKLNITCEDGKLATNVKECLTNIIAASSSLQV